MISLRLLPLGILNERMIRKRYLNRQNTKTSNSKNNVISYQNPIKLRERKRERGKEKKRARKGENLRESNEEVVKAGVSLSDQSKIQGEPANDLLFNSHSVQLGGWMGRWGVRWWQEGGWMLGGGGRLRFWMK